MEIRRGDFVLVRTGMMERCLAEGDWGSYAGGDAAGMRFETAVWVFKKSIELNPKFIHAYTALGASYIKQGESEEAIEVLNRAEKVCPKDSNVYF